MKNNKWLVVLIMMLVAALAATGCGGKDGDTIKVGVNYELSGDVAAYGLRQKTPFFGF